VKKNDPFEEGMYFCFDVTVFFNTCNSRVYPEEAAANFLRSFGPSVKNEPDEDTKVFVKQEDTTPSGERI
jgi:hypothetical protein